MKFIETAVRWRHGTFAAFFLLALFGVLALLNLPLELQPGGDRPQITIATPYPGAGPTEVEDLITRPIEEQMEEVEGIYEMTSNSRPGSSQITLEFNQGSNMNERLLDTLNRLQQVRSLPPEAQESSVNLVSGSRSPMMWLIMLPKDNGEPDALRYRDLADDVIIPRLRQVTGVGDFIIGGGQEREVEVRVDPKALADRNLGISDVVRTLQDNNRDIRGGPLTLGRREYRVRTVSRSQELDQIGEFVLRRNDQGTVFLRDVAKIEMGRKPLDSVLLFNDRSTVAIGIIRRGGANVPVVSRQVRETIAELEAQFDRQNQAVRFFVNYDENDYISQSVLLVQENLLGGSILAVIVLLLFLGSMRTVAVVALTIPVTMVTVFIAMSALGRTLNIISLAGLGFAAGMVVDNAIVVIENAFTHMQQGKTPMKAAIDGTKEVAGGIFGATLTNIAVFVPLALVQGEVRELFIDMAIAISAAAIFSMGAAITLVPMLSGLFLSREEAIQVLEGGTYRGGNWFTRSVANTSALFRVWQGKLEQLLTRTVGWSLGAGRMGRRLLVLSIPVSLLVATIFLLPPADYLPDGNRNQVRWLAEPLPGTSLPEIVKLSEAPRKWLRSQAEVDNILVVQRTGFRAIAASLKPEFATTEHLTNFIQRMLQQSSNFPGYRFLFPNRNSIFQDPGKEFRVDIVGPDLNELSQLEQQLTGELRKLPGVVSARSNFVTGAAELQVVPNRIRAAESGLTEGDIGTMVEAALGGRFASNFIDGKEDLDVSVELQNTFVQTPEELRQLPLYSRNGTQVQLGDVADVRETTGPDVINHVDLERSITITTSLSPTSALGDLIQRAERQILAPMRGTLPPGYRVNLAGSADRLTETISQLTAVFALSVVIIYLLLMALYRSFIYPIVIMATVPMGMSGALLSMVIANRIFGMSVPLDMITALGFIILTGVVVNNAILLVERALQLQEDGMEYDASLYNATRDRLRAIFMSAITSVLGMLPLAIVPGQGAELYQGLGIVLTGGLAFSTILTPTVVPALMGLLYDFTGRKRSTSLPSQVQIPINS
jgi:hydrophobic/amphiphilic exporter-1 (mainly G- bacteria), HAE1 family